jgi:hypothetical protein
VCGKTVSHGPRVCVCVCVCVWREGARFGCGCLELGDERGGDSEWRLCNNSRAIKMFMRIVTLQ